MSEFALRSWRNTLSTPLNKALVFSSALHLLLMMITFAPPDPLKFKPMDSRLEVILLNARGADRPVTPDVVAQVDMTAGGEHETGRAKSPLAPDERFEAGTDVERKQQRVAELEDAQRQLMAMTRSVQTFVEQPESKTTPNAQGSDDEDIQFKIAMLQAQIEKSIDAYNKRPRRLTYGVNAVGETYARYVTDWAARIEQIGTARYPAEARGKLYDSLVITVEIQKDGQVGNIVINRKSQHEPLNKAIREIVLAGAPYERFTPEMSAQGDVLQIVRTWTFTNESLQSSAAPATGG